MNLTILTGKLYYPENAVGNMIGYATHAEETTKALKKRGIRFVTGNDEGAKPDLVLHQCPAHVAYKVEGLPNVLYTAYEALDLPPEYIAQAKLMDLIVCTSSFTAKAFTRALNHSVPVEVAPLGVDVKLFRYFKRKQTEPFRFLWVGAPNQRKGWELLREAWRYGFANRADCCLYVKTTGRDKLEVSGNVIVDSRNVTREELCGIYHGAHCFIYPSYGEGFGLTLAEAMATGLPCIVTPWGGVTDFADKSTTFPLRYRVVPVSYGVPTTAAEADTRHMGENMRWIWNNYNKALNRGKDASRVINKGFTWANTAEALNRLFERFKR